MTWDGFLNWFKQIMDVILPVGMVIGPVSGYIPQYILLHQTGTIGTFSPLVCFILIISMTLRILYWYGERFEIPLLLQSILMLIAQIAILYQVIVIARRHPLSHHNKTISKGFLVTKIILSIAFSIFLLNFVIKQQFIIEILGISALFIEACLPVPQWIENYKRKSTSGLSVFMVATWMIGDSFKTFYYYYRDTPIYFFVCGCFQLSIDLMIGYQLYSYRHITLDDGDDGENLALVSSE